MASYLCSGSENLLPCPSDIFRFRCIMGIPSSWLHYSKQPTVAIGITTKHCSSEDHNSGSPQNPFRHPFIWVWVKLGYRFIFLKTNQISGPLLKVWPSFLASCSSLILVAFHCKNEEPGHWSQRFDPQPTHQKCSCCLELQSPVAPQATSQCPGYVPFFSDVTWATKQWNT